MKNDVLSQKPIPETRARDDKVTAQTTAPTLKSPHKRTSPAEWNRIRENLRRSIERLDKAGAAAN